MSGYSGSARAPSPSVLSHLRQYRFQKKPEYPESGPSSGAVNGSGSSTGQVPIRVTSSNMQMQRSQPGVVRSQLGVARSQPGVVRSPQTAVRSQRPFISSQPAVVRSQPTVVRSQTGFFTNQPVGVTNQPGVVKTQPGVVYKRIRIQDSDSDDANSPAKKMAAVTELTTAVKERRFRNMSEMFPDISPMLIKNTLVKQNWNEERCRDELLKHDPETSSSYSRPGNSGNQARPGASNGATRIVQPVGNTTIIRKVGTGGGGRARHGSDSDDNDYGVRKGKDDRVYDSSDSDNEISDNLIGDKKKVFEFLNTSTLNELMMLNGCSQRKAEAIVASRPFSGWLDMVEKFNSNKVLSTELLNSTQELLSTRNNIQRLMKKCVGLATQLEAAVAAGAGMLRQPEILGDDSLKLANYQIIGLNWLAVLHKQGVSGILADEMGLGKTVQVIAFLAHLKQTAQAKAPHLVVVPASTLNNWDGEFARWCPSLRVSKYYGAPEERRQLRIEYAREGLANTDVILTTYTMVSSCPEERKMFRITPIHYVIYDEAHMLKNMATQRYDNLLKIKSKYRLLLTGTPLQNNLLELMSLLCFVMPHMFSGKTDDLKSLFQKSSKVKSTQKGEIKDKKDDVPLFEQSQITQAKRIMKPFVLRRLKKDVLQDLPKKSNHMELCEMSERQAILYKNLIQSFKAKDGTIHSTTELSGMSMMMDMRKLANHPLLLRYHYSDAELRKMAAILARDPAYKEKSPDYAFENLSFMSDFQIHRLTQSHSSISQFAVPDDLIVDSGKFNKLDEMLPRLKRAGHRVLLFSQFTMMLDVLEPYLALRGHHYLRLDGNTAVVDRQDLIDKYNEEDIFVFLLSTKAGGLGINLTAADTVIIHDIDFNPYNDKQAEDRCHRLGQTREVTIYRLLSGGTIEEGIYQVAQEKLNLEKHVTGEDENDAQEHKNVVRLLSAALGLTAGK